MDMIDMTISATVSPGVLGCLNSGKFLSAEAPLNKLVSTAVGNGLVEWELYKRYYKDDYYHGKTNTKLVVLVELPTLAVPHLDLESIGVFENANLRNGVTRLAVETGALAPCYVGHLVGVWQRTQQCPTLYYDENTRRWMFKMENLLHDDAEYEAINIGADELLWAVDYHRETVERCMDYNKREECIELLNIMVAQARYLA